MWTVYNGTTNSLNVADIGMPQLIPPFGTAEFAATDFLSSRILAAAVGSGQVCIVNFGDFLPLAAGWAPITYPVHPTAAEVSSGASSPLTIAPFSAATLYLNITEVSEGGSLAVSWEPLVYDLVGGIVYFSAESIISGIATPEQVAMYDAFTDLDVAGRFTWTVAGSVTFSLVLKMR